MSDDEQSSEEQAEARDLSLEEESFDPSDTSSLQNKVEELEKALAESQDKYTRALADFENLRVRTRKERGDLLKYQGESIVLDIIPVLDNLDLALQHAGADPKAILQGMEMVHKQFIDALSRWEIRADSAVGQAFDPNRHNAISKEPSSEAEAGTVLKELKKAFFYKDKLIRPAEVVVSEAGEPEATASQAAGEEKEVAGSGS